MNPENPSCPAPLVAFRLRHRDSWGPCVLRWSSGPGDGAPDGLTPEDFHDLARILESTARGMRREADKRWAERKVGGDGGRRRGAQGAWEMIRIVIDKASYERGRSDGETRRNSKVPPGIDSFSYYSGYIEGQAIRERTKYRLFVPEDPKKES